MPLDELVPEQLTAKAAALGHAENTPAEKAACEAYTRAALPPELAVLALAALGLADPYQPLPGIEDTGPCRAKHTGAATHGTESGFEWHRTTRVPLCSECRKWGDENENENGAR
ncbi:MAG TPA: hypothetical protein VGG83_10595 [Trebonia sp.]|jgi:hypothetical protein